MALTHYPRGNSVLYFMNGKAAEVRIGIAHRELKRVTQIGDRTVRMKSDPTLDGWANFTR